MIYSMTGYSLNSSQIAKDLVFIEVRCLNSKYFDFSFKAPDIFFQIENDVKKIVKKKLKRGKIEIRLKKNVFKANNHEIINDINYKMNILKSISPDTSRDKLMHLSLLIPKLNQIKFNKVSEIYKKKLFLLINKSLEDIVHFRKKEGSSLQKEIFKYLKQISVQLNKIKKRDKKRIHQKKKKLKNNLNELIKNPDKKRLEEEVIYYIEKLDIEEEIVRLNHQINYFHEIVKNDHEIGKTINFLVQEMNREVNTIGSKSNDFELQKCVVVIKENLEKIKEQIQNVL
tara:strand:+ start:4394 stop:5248 length:855 start_codon:yes stop_codon:yes gene_type:complete